MRVVLVGLLGINFMIDLCVTHRMPCDVRAWTETGWVCGLRRWSENGKVYASFRGVPYAKQPVGELRFKELQPADPWDGDYDAREEGPVCPQHDEIYGSLTVQEYGMSEACIHANIHVPLHALPKNEKKHNKNDKKKLETTYVVAKDKKDDIKDTSGDIVEREKVSEIKPLMDKKTIYKIKQQKHINGLIYPKENEETIKGIEEKLNNIYNKYGSSNPLFKNEDKYNHTPIYESSNHNLNTDNLFEWLEQINKNNVLKPKQDEARKVSDEKEPNYFWPNNDKQHVGDGVQFIMDTWPKFQKKEHEGSLYSLPLYRGKRYANNDEVTTKRNHQKKLLPVLVFVHGGGFNSGSGDSDLHGPEYLVSKNVIVITFNYRIGVFGFLSLNTPNVPGNNGLRDAITLLRWVQKNVKQFGGDPDNVTLMGQSSGASNAHLLSLSEATKGLFKRVLLLSGTAYQAYYTVSPIYSATITANFLAILGIVSVNPEEIHKELIRMPIERIVEANSLIQAQYGLATFTPVVESKFPGVTRVIDKDPETLIAEGRAKEYPFIIGCTTTEAETFRRRLGYERYVSRIIANPRLILPAGITFSTLPNVSLALGEKVKNRCFKDKSYLDGVVRCYTEIAFVYQAFRLARERAARDSAPTYLYQFSYEGDFNLIKEALKINYKGSAHVEDLTYVFRANSLLEPKSDFPPNNRDDMMKDWMTAFVVNFMECSDPICNTKSRKFGWPPVTKDDLIYEVIESPYVFKVSKPTYKLRDVIDFYDEIYKLSASVNATQLADKTSTNV